VKLCFIISVIYLKQMIYVCSFYLVVFLNFPWKSRFIGTYHLIAFGFIQFIVKSYSISIHWHYIIVVEMINSANDKIMFLII